MSYTTKDTELGIKSHNFAVFLMERTWEINQSATFKEKFGIPARVEVHTIGDPFVNILSTPNTIHKEAIHGNRENLTVMPSLFYRTEYKVFFVVVVFIKN